MLAITDVAQFFTDNNGHWICKQTGKTILGDILNLYRTSDGLARLGLPLTDEVQYIQNDAARYQIFERGIVYYDPSRKTDSPPGTQGTCYFGHINAGPAYNGLVQPLMKQIGDLTASQTILQQQLVQAQKDLAAAQEKISELQNMPLPVVQPIDIEGKLKNALEKMAASLNTEIN